MKNSIVKGLAFIFLSFTSCVTEKISPEKQTFAGQEYFPYMLNEERIYEIYEINYTNFGTDTTHYFQKEVITSISEEENETRYYTNVYSAPKLDSAFTIEEIYSITVKEKQIIETKNNVVNLIVVLPITKNLQFDRNLYNAEKTAYTTVKSLNENKSYSDFLATRIF